MIELAMVGLGRWGRRLVEAVQGKSDRVRFRAAVAPRPDRACEFAARHGLVLETDYAAVLRDPAIAGIVSCGPAYLHAKHARTALQAGKPVLSIKPLANSPDDARMLLDLSRQTGVLLALGYNRCFMPNVAELRRRLRTGALGRLLHVEGNFCTNRYGGIPADNWKADPKFVPAGSLADHMLYLTIETLGHVAEVHAMSASDVSANALADVTAVLLRTTSGATGMLTAIGVTPDYFRFQVFGTSGWLELRGDRHLTFQPAEGERQEIALPPLDPERAQLEAFADAVADIGAFPVPIEDAAHSVAVLDAMGRSALQRHAIEID